METINRNIIFFTDRNIHGAVVVYGAYGVKQYYGYTIAEARRKYLESDRIFVNQRKVNPADNKKHILL